MGTSRITDCTLSDGSFFDEYTFTATAGQQLSISMSSATFDTYLIMLDPDNVDTQDDDGGGGHQYFADSSWQRLHRRYKDRHVFNPCEFIRSQQRLAPTQ